MPSRMAAGSRRRSRRERAGLVGCIAGVAAGWLATVRGMGALGAGLGGAATGAGAGIGGMLRGAGWVGGVVAGEGGMRRRRPGSTGWRMGGGLTGSSGAGLAVVRGRTVGGGEESGGNPTASMKRRRRSCSLSEGVGRADPGRAGPPPGLAPAFAITFAMITMIRTMKGNRCATGRVYLTSSCERSGPAMVSRIFVSASMLRIFM